VDSSGGILEIAQFGAYLNLQGEGELRVASRRQGGRWKELLKKKIIQADPV